MRRLLILVRHLPAESSLAQAIHGGPSWSITDHLIDDLRMALTNSKKHPAKPHPQRPLGIKKRLNPKRLADGRRRRAERRRQIEAGEIT